MNDQSSSCDGRHHRARSRVADGKSSAESGASNSENLRIIVVHDASLESRHGAVQASSER